MAGEYIFKNPILKEIHLSYMRMNATLDALFSIFNAFISNKLSNSEKEKIMENKDDLDFSLKNTKVTLDEVKEEYEYLDLVLNQNFTEFSHPVMDNEGFVREKYQYNVDKSILNQKRPVTIIESADLRKIQKDYKTIEKRFDDMSRMFVIMMAKMDDQNKKIDELLAENKKQAKTIEEQNEMIMGLKEDIALISKQAQYQFNVMENKLAIEKTIIQNQENMLNKQVIQMEKQARHMEKQDKVIAEQSIRIINLEKMVGLVNENGLHLSSRKRKKDENYSNEEMLEVIPLPNQKWIGSPYHLGIGIRDTFSIFTSSRVLHKEKYENELKKSAFSGDIKRMQDLINRDKSILNGRGMPDSLCSRVHAFYDKTPIMLAAQKGHLNCVNLLIENEVEINYLDRDNFTALDYAQQNFHKEIADLLKNCGGVNGADILNVLKQKEINEIADDFHVIEKNTKNYTPSFTSIAK